MSTIISTTQIPKGTEDFFKAVERLKNAPQNCTNIFDMATQCCKLCTKSEEFSCEDCYVQTVGDLHDPYRKEIQKGTPTGMYSSGIYKDAKGDYHYAHPQGSA